MKPTKILSVNFLLIGILVLGARVQSETSAPAAPSASADSAVPPRGGQGKVKIITRPEKAVAYLGGIKLGNTPIDTVFESGRHTLTLMLNGEELVKQRVSVWPNKTLTIDTALALPYGTVVIKPEPVTANYTVTIDGEDVGNTHGGVLTINKLDIGTRVIRVSNGKRSKEFKVEILAEQSVDLEANFKKGK